MASQSKVTVRIGVDVNEPEARLLPGVPPVWNVAPGRIVGVADRFEAEIDLDPHAMVNGRVIMIGRPRMLVVDGDFGAYLDGRVYPPGYRPSWDKAEEVQEAPAKEDECNEG